MTRPTRTGSSRKYGVFGSPSRNGAARTKAASPLAGCRRVAPPTTRTRTVAATGSGTRARAVTAATARNAARSHHGETPPVAAAPALAPSGAPAVPRLGIPMQARPPARARLSVASYARLAGTRRATASPGSVRPSIESSFPPGKNLAHDVDGLPLGLVVGAHEHLPQEPHAHELEAHDDQEDRQEQDRPVREADPLDDPLVGEDGREQEAGAAGHEAQEAEDLDRPGPVAHQELHGQEIEQHADGPPQAVLRDPAPPRPVGDRDLRDRGAHPPGQRREEAVHLAVERDVPQDLPAVHLEPA